MAMHLKQDTIQDTDKFMKVFPDYIRNTEHIIYICMNSSLQIKDFNRKFHTLFKQELQNGPIDIFKITIEEHHDIFRKLPRNTIKTRVGFAPGKSQVFALDCHIYKVDNDYILLGSHLMLTGDQTIRKIASINKELAQLTRELHKKNRELEEANRKIKTLSGLIPICAWCKKIRNDEGYWSKIEEYIQSHTDAEFSHGICPDCMENKFSEID